ncbi:hypothetical protein LINPERPRIM_LOCUS37606 [Linum perenne]
MFAEAMNALSGGSWNSQSTANMWQLPDRYKLLHFAIIHVLFPKSTFQTVVCPMDAWILHNVVARNPLSYAYLMFSHMVDIDTDFALGDLPYGVLITTLLQRLGLSVHHKYTRGAHVRQMRAQHVLRDIHWRPSEWFCGSGNDTGGDAGEEEVSSTYSTGLVSYGVPGMPW